MRLPPLSYEISRNRLGNYYQYFYCLGRQARKNGCTFVAIQAHHAEQLFEDHWATITLPDEPSPQYANWSSPTSTPSSKNATTKHTKQKPSSLTPPPTANT